MWRLIYNICLWLALPFFAGFSLTSRKIRANFLERLLPPPLQGLPGGIVWIHAASLGEAVIAENLVGYLGGKLKNPFLVTTNTHYTRDLLRKRLVGRATVRSLPFDLPCSIKRFMAGSRFAALLLVETEIWPNLIWIAKRKGIPVLIVNGRISDSTIGRYRLLSSFLKKVLSCIDLVLAQSEEHARRFVSLGMAQSKVVSTGNLKYYREIAQKADGESEGVRTVTFGSVKEKELPDVMLAVRGVRERFPDVRIFVVPREMSLVDRIDADLSTSYSVTRYSAVKQSAVPEGNLVLVDTVGDLLAIYGRSMVAFVGGSLAPYGGQNILEPLFVGTPVVFGPHMNNFKAIAETIIDEGAGVEVHNGAELLSVIARIVEDASFRRRLVDAGRNVLAIQRGVMEKTAGRILEMVWKNSTSS